MVLWAAAALAGTGSSCHAPVSEAQPRARASAPVVAAPVVEDVAGPLMAGPDGEAAAAVADAGAAEAPPALVVPPGALDAFYAALDRAAAADPADPGGRVGVVVFGDSHTAG